MLQNGFQSTIPQSHFLFHSFLLACSILQYDTDDYYHIIFLDSSLETFETCSHCWPSTVIACDFTIVVLVCRFYCFILPCCWFAGSLLWLSGLLTWELLHCISCEYWLTRLLILASMRACIWDGHISLLWQSTERNRHLLLSTDCKGSQGWLAVHISATYMKLIPPMASHYCKE